jgi:hypothetical protein
MNERSLSTRVAVCLLAMFSVAYFALSIKTARTAFLNHDEPFTMWIVRDTPSIFHALTIGADTAPPTYYYALRGVCHLMGYTNLAIRLPTIVSFYIFMVSIFLLTRRHFGVPIAACAAILPLYSAAGEAASAIARPYATVMACYGLVCLIWSGDTSKNPAIWRYLSIGFLLALSIWMHFYAVILVGLFLIMEVVWSFRNRSIRWPMWISAAIGAAGGLAPSLLVIVPLYKATHSSAAAQQYYARPEPHKLLLFVQDIGFNPGMIRVYIVAIFIGAGYLVYRQNHARSARQALAPYVPADGDFMGTIAFSAFLYPIATLVLAILVTRVFNERYFFGSALGIGMGFALLARRLQWTAGPALTLLAFLTLFYAKDLRHGLGIHVKPDGQTDIMTQVPDGYPVITPGGPDFFVFAESPNPKIRELDTYVLPPAGMHNPNPEPERMAVAWKQLRPDLKVMSAEDFFQRYPKFYLRSDTTDETEGLSAYILNHKHAVVYRYDHTLILFEVTQ